MKSVINRGVVALAILSLKSATMSSALVIANTHHPSACLRLTDSESMG